MSSLGDWFHSIVDAVWHFAGWISSREFGSRGRARYVDAKERIAPGATGTVDHDGTHRVARNVGNLPIQAFHHARIVREVNDVLEVDAAEQRFEGS